MTRKTLYKENAIANKKNRKIFVSAFFREFPQASKKHGPDNWKKKYLEDISVC